MENRTRRGTGLEALIARHHSFSYVQFSRKSHLKLYNENWKAVKMSGEKKMSVPGVYFISRGLA